MCNCALELEKSTTNIFFKSRLDSIFSNLAHTNVLHHDMTCPPTAAEVTTYNTDIISIIIN